MKIKGIDRELEMAVKTRKIDRLVNAELLRGVTADENGKPIMDATNIDRAEEMLVCLTFGLSQEETDKLESAEYRKLVAAINERDAEKKVFTDPA